MTPLYTALLMALICLLLGLPALLRTGSWRYVLGGALLVFAFMLAALAAPHKLFAGLPPPVSEGNNWTGALLMLLVGATAVGLLTRLAGWKREEFGLRLRFHPGTGADVARYLLPLLVVELGVLWLLIPGGSTSWERHVFQLLAPGITEELVFRGVLLALLDRAFAGRVRVLRADLGWGTVVSSVVFGLCHGLRVGADFDVTVRLMPMLIPTVGGFVLAWCRARSGSLLLPILVHGGMNEVAQLIVLLKARR